MDAVVFYPWNSMYSTLGKDLLDGNGNAPFLSSSVEIWGDGI